MGIRHVRQLRRMNGEISCVSTGRIGTKRHVAAGFNPEFIPIPAGARLQHHQFMVAAQGDEFAAFLPGDEPIENSTGMRAAIDVVAERDDNIVRVKRHEFGERGQRLETTMDVANGQVTHD